MLVEILPWENLRGTIDAILLIKHQLIAKGETP
jgi:hypothetical protein